LRGLGFSPKIAVSAITTQKVLAVEKRPQGSHPPPASVTKLIDFPRVQLNRDPHPAVRFADQLDSFRHLVRPIVKHCGPASIIGEFPIDCGAGKILPVIVDNQHLDGLAIVHWWEHNAKGLL
jgi:hypothetical protein